MTPTPHSEIHARFAARKLSPAKAADMVIEERAARAQSGERKTRNPFILVGMFLLACVASLFGIKTNES